MSSSSSKSKSGTVSVLTSERFVGSGFDAAVAAHSGVLVFSKTTCPFCDRVKAAFAAKAIPYSVVELDRVDKAAEVRKELTRLSGISTVPVIFIGGKLIGDSSTTIRKLSQGELDSTLRDAGISL